MEMEGRAAAKGCIDACFTGGKRIRQHDRRHQIRDLGATKATFTESAAPAKQQRTRYPMTTRRRRGLPMTLKALLDDPKLLLKAPTPTTASVDHFETTNLRTILMTIHKDSQHQITRDR
jgi:hypothetical protein